MIDARSNGSIGLFTKRPYKVMVCAVTLVAFLFNIVSYDLAWSASPSASQAGPSHKELNAKTFTLPQSLGTVKDSWAGEHKRTGAQEHTTIIHIQDAHCNYYAQHAISDILEYLDKEYGIGTINLEGGARDYDLSIFTGIKDKSARERVADHFVREGIVNGAEYFAVNNPDKTALWGIEEPRLYIENLKAYRESLKTKDDRDRLIRNLSYILTNLKMKIYSKELLELDLKYSQYKANKLDFKDYLNYLLANSKAKLIDIKSFGNIFLLNQALKQEGAIDFNKANNQRDALIDRLQKKISRNALKELVAKTVEFRTEAISQEEFYSYLVKAVKSVNLSVADYPELEKYVVYISSYSAVNKPKIIDEVSGLEARLREAVYRSDEERALDKLSRNFALLKNIFDISLSREDYRYYRANESSFDMRNYVSFINSRRGGLNPPYDGAGSNDLSAFSRLDGYREDIGKFYEYSFKRDATFLRNLKLSNSRADFNLPAAANSGAAVLITGGFHTENLADLFRKNNISYVSIVPNFTIRNGYECPYFKILSGEKRINFAEGIASVMGTALATPDPFSPEMVSALNAAGMNVSSPSAAAKPTQDIKAPPADMGGNFLPMVNRGMYGEAAKALVTAWEYRNESPLYENALQNLIDDLRSGDVSDLQRKRIMAELKTQSPDAWKAVNGMLASPEPAMAGNQPALRAPDLGQAGIPVSASVASSFKIDRRTALQKGALGIIAIFAGFSGINAERRAEGRESIETPALEARLAGFIEKGAFRENFISFKREENVERRSWQEYYLPDIVSHYLEPVSLIEWQRFYNEEQHKELSDDDSKKVLQFLDLARDPKTMPSALGEAYYDAQSIYGKGQGTSYRLYGSLSESHLGHSNQYILQLLEFILSRTVSVRIESMFKSEYETIRTAYDFLMGKSSLSDRGAKEALKLLPGVCAKIQPRLAAEYKSIRKEQVMRMKKELSETTKGVSLDELTDWFTESGVKISFEDATEANVKKFYALIAFFALKNIPPSSLKGAKICFNNKGRMSYNDESDTIYFGIKTGLNTQKYRTLSKLKSTMLHELAHRWDIRMKEGMRRQYYGINWSWDVHKKVIDAQKKRTEVLPLEIPKADANAWDFVGYIGSFDVFGEAAEEDLAAVTECLYLDYDSTVKKSIENLIKRKDPDLAQKIFFISGFYGKVLSGDLWVVRDDDAPIDQDAGIYIFKEAGKIYRVTVKDEGDKQVTEITEGLSYDPDGAIKRLMKKQAGVAARSKIFFVPTPTALARRNPKDEDGPEPAVAKPVQGIKAPPADMGGNFLPMVGRGMFDKAAQALVTAWEYRNEGPEYENALQNLIDDLRSGDVSDLQRKEIITELKTQNPDAWKAVNSMLAVPEPAAAPVVAMQHRSLDNAGELVMSRDFPAMARVLSNSEYYAGQLYYPFAEELKGKLIGKGFDMKLDGILNHACYEMALNLMQYGRGGTISVFIINGDNGEKRLEIIGKNNLPDKDFDPAAALKYSMGQQMAREEESRGIDGGMGLYNIVFFPDEVMIETNGGCWIKEKTGDGGYDFALKKIPRASEADKTTVTLVWKTAPLAIVASTAPESAAGQPVATATLESSLERAVEAAQRSGSSSQKQLVADTSYAVYDILVKHGELNDHTIIYPAGGIDALPAAAGVPTIIIDQRVNGPDRNLSQDAAAMLSEVGKNSGVDGQLTYQAGDAGRPEALAEARGKVKTPKVTVLLKGAVGYMLPESEYDPESRREEAVNLIDNMIRTLSPDQFVILNSEDRFYCLEHLRQKGYGEVVCDWTVPHIDKKFPVGDNVTFGNVKMLYPTRVTIVRRTGATNGPVAPVQAQDEIKADYGWEGRVTREQAKKIFHIAESIGTHVTMPRVVTQAIESVIGPRYDKHGAIRYEYPVIRFVRDEVKEGVKGPIRYREYDGPEMIVVGEKEWRGIYNGDVEAAARIAHEFMAGWVVSHNEKPGVDKIDDKEAHDLSMTVEQIILTNAFNSPAPILAYGSKAKENDSRALARSVNAVLESETRLKVMLQELRQAYEAADRETEAIDNDSRQKAAEIGRRAGWLLQEVRKTVDTAKAQVDAFSDKKGAVGLAVRLQIEVLVDCVGRMDKLISGAEYEFKGRAGLWEVINPAQGEMLENHEAVYGPFTLDPPGYTQAMNRLNERIRADSRVSETITYWRASEYAEKYGRNAKYIIDKMFTIWDSAREADSAGENENEDALKYMLRLCFKNDRVLFAVNKEGQMVGFLSYSIDKQNVTRAGYLEHRAVLPRYWNDTESGRPSLRIGSILLDLALMQLREQGIEKFRFESVPERIGSHKRYTDNRIRENKIEGEWKDNKFYGKIRDGITVPELQKAVVAAPSAASEVGRGLTEAPAVQAEAAAVSSGIGVNDETARKALLVINKKEELVLVLSERRELLKLEYERLRRIYEKIPGDENDPRKNAAERQLESRKAELEAIIGNIKEAAREVIKEARGRSLFEEMIKRVAARILDSEGEVIPADLGYTIQAVTTDLVVLENGARLAGEINKCRELLYEIGRNFTKEQITEMAIDFVKRDMYDSAIKVRAAVPPAGEAIATSSAASGESMVRQAEAANSAVNDIAGGTVDWIITPKPADLTVLTAGQKAGVDSEILRKYENSDTHIESYEYKEGYGIERFESEIRKVLNAVSAAMTKSDNLNKSPMAIIYAPDKACGRDASGKAVSGYDVITGILAEGAYSSLKSRVTIIRERVPANGLIHEAAHVDLGKALLNYERQKGEAAPEQRSRLAAFVKALVPEQAIAGLSDDAILQGIIKGDIVLDIIVPVDMNDNWRKHQLRYLNLRTAV